MDDYTPEAGSDEFKRFALLLVLQILTERTVRTKSQIYGGMHAPTVLLKKAFCKHADTQVYKRDGRFAKFCNGTELSTYFDTVRRLLTRSPNEHSEYSIQHPSTSKKTRRMIQEWYEENQEVVEKKRESIHSLVVTAFEVIWDIYSGLDKDAVVEKFHGDWRIVEAMENDEYLVGALFQSDQICNMYAVVATKKGAACGLDYIAKNRLFEDEESSTYRWDIVSCKIHTNMPAVSVPHRQHLAAIENKIQQEEEQLDHVVDHIEMSACVDTICNQELRPNIDHSRVCEAALLRLEFLMDKRKFIKVQDLVEENAAELIPHVMSRHEHNKVIQGCGLTLFVCQQSGLAKTLYRAALNVEECICSIMMNFQDELQFHRLGLQVLLVLQECAEKDDSLERWYLKMIDANALDALTTALNSHAAHYSIVKRSMTLLGNILGGNEDVMDRKTLVEHDDLGSAINNASEMRNIVKRAYYVQMEEQPEKAEEELKPLRKRVVSLTKRLRQLHKSPAESS